MHTVVQLIPPVDNWKPSHYVAIMCLNKKHSLMAFYFVNVMTDFTLNDALVLRYMLGMKGCTYLINVQP